LSIPEHIEDSYSFLSSGAMEALKGVRITGGIASIGCCWAPNLLLQMTTFTSSVRPETALFSLSIS